jgi:O-antigen/teichoic acid export membrane protein
VRPSLVKDTAFNTASFAVRVVAMLVAVAWIARALGPEGQGRFGFAHWIAIVLGQLAIWGLGMAMTRFVARSVGAGRPEEARAVVGQAGRWLHPTVAVIVGLGVPLAALLGGDLRGPLMVAMPYAAACAWVAWRVGLSHGLRRFDVVLAGDVAYWTLLLLLLGPALRSADPILGAMVAHLVARTVHVAIVWLWTERVLRAIAPGSSAEPPPRPLYLELRSYALQMAALAVFGAVLWERSEIAFLKARATYEDIGFYTAAFGISILAIRVPSVLGQVMLPLVAGMHGAEARRDEIGSAFRRGARLLSLVMTGPVAILLAATPAVVMVMYEDAYDPAAPLLRLLLLPLLLSGVGAIAAQTLVGAGGHSALLRLTSWVASLKMWLCIVLVPLWGAMGAALACGLAQGAGLAAQGGLAARRFPRCDGEPESRWRQQVAVGAAAAAGTLLAGLLVGGEARGTDPLLALAVQFAGGAMAWGIALWKLGPLPPEDVAMLRDALAKLRRPSISA